MLMKCAFQRNTLRPWGIWKRVRECVGEKGVSTRAVAGFGLGANLKIACQTQIKQINLSTHSTSLLRQSWLCPHQTLFSSTLGTPRCRTLGVGPQRLENKSQNGRPICFFAVYSTRCELPLWLRHFLQIALVGRVATHTVKGCQAPIII